MKKIILGTLAACFMLAASITPTQAQVSVNVHLGAWNPPAEYSDVNYYYLPDVDSYYYVPTHQYVYLDNGSWVFRNQLPPRYASYNISTGYKVAVNRPRAYQYYSYDRSHYNRYRGTHTKEVIVRDHYRTRVVNNTRVINNTRVVNHTRVVHAKPRVINHTRVVNRTKVVHAKPRVVNHTRVINHTRVVHAKPAAQHHAKPAAHHQSKPAVQHKPNNAQHNGHDKH